ncbi:MAG: hypothetical protein ABJN62_05440 [Halioglobus sp.]
MGLLLLGVNTALAEEVVPEADGYCLQAQKIIAGTDLEPTVVYHQDYEAFVESKPTDQPFTIHRYDSAPLVADYSINTVVSCKLRTAERINATHDREGGAVPVASVETSCHEVHRVALENAFAAVPEPERKLQIGDWLIEEEDMQFMGPKWLEPWPFTAVTRSQGGQYQLHTRALYAPHAWWVPMPERFLGNYYCHLASPQYLEALIRGQVQPH